MERNIFKLDFKFINLIDTNEYTLQYYEEDEQIKHNITKSELNITFKNKDFNFKICNKTMEKKYYANLLLNYNNEIEIDLNNIKKDYNIEFISKNVKGKYFKFLYILYNEVRYNFQTEYNNLNLSRILLFNIPLKK